MLTDIRDAITTVIGAHQEIADDDLAQLVGAMLIAEKQCLRKVAGLDDEELDRAASERSDSTPCTETQTVQRETAGPARWRR